MVSGVVLQLAFKPCSNLQFYPWFCSTLQRMRLPYSLFNRNKHWILEGAILLCNMCIIYYISIYIYICAVCAVCASLFIWCSASLAVPMPKQNIEVALSITALLLVQKTSAAATVLANVAPKLHWRGCFFVFSYFSCLI